MSPDKKLFLNYPRASDLYLWLILFFAFFTASRLSASDAPSVPFYYPSGTAVEPQIATLVVGVNENVGQAVVSGDRKHVTLDMDTSLLGSAAIHNFTYQKGGLGFVGSGAPAQPTPGSLTPTIKTTPDQIGPMTSILDKPGMVLIAPLER